MKRGKRVEGSNAVRKEETINSTEQQLPVLSDALGFAVKIPGPNATDNDQCEFESLTKSKKKPRVIATYDYCDEEGSPIFQVVFYDSNESRSRCPTSSGGWSWSMKDVPMIPYRLPELIENFSDFVVIVQSEKEVDNLQEIGVTATCNAGGAGKWTEEHAQFLLHRDVVILGNNDESGRDHSWQVARSLRRIAELIYVINLPGLPPGGSVSDWIAAGGTREKLEKIIASSPCGIPRKALL